MGATPFIIGGITALSTVFVAFIRIPGGYIADRFGRKKIIVTMTFTVALAYLFYAFAPSWEWIFVGALISNFCLIYQPALMAMRADSVSPEKRGTGFAFILLTALIFVGFVLVIFLVKEPTEREL